LAETVDPDPAFGKLHRIGTGDRPALIEAAVRDDEQDRGDEAERVHAPRVTPEDRQADRAAADSSRETDHDRQPCGHWIRARDREPGERSDHEPHHHYADDETEHSRVEVYASYL